MLISGRLLLVRPFPALQIPNLKTALATYQSHFAFQTKLSAKLFRQYEPTLPVRACMLSAGMQLAQKNAAITRGNCLICLRSRTRFPKLRRRHNDEKLMSRLRQKDEFFRATVSPARRNGDPIFIVDRMPELSGIQTFGLGIGVH